MTRSPKNRYLAALESERAGSVVTEPKAGAAAEQKAAVKAEPEAVAVYGAGPRHCVPSTQTVAAYADAKRRGLVRLASVLAKDIAHNN